MHFSRENKLVSRKKSNPSVFSARTVATAALVCALSVLFPQIFHLIGGNTLGNAFLPMHLPVLLGGYLLNPSAAMLCGMLSPTVSFLLTGMPAIPRLFFMILELGAYGLFSSLFAQKYRLPVFLSLPLAQLAGRAVYFLCLVFALHILHLEIAGMPSAAAVLGSAVAAGIPGIILQLCTVPVLLAALRKAKVIRYVPRFGKL